MCQLKTSEATYLPPLQQQTPIDRPKPHDGITCLEVLEPVALVPEVYAQAFQQLRRGCLYDSLSRCWLLTADDCRRLLRLRKTQECCFGCELLAHRAVRVCVVVCVVCSDDVHVVWFFLGQRRNRLAHGQTRVVTRNGCAFLYVFVLVDDYRMNIVQQWLPERRQILVLVVEFLFAVVCCREPLPAKRVNEERMFLKILLESIFLRNYFSTVVVVIIIIIDMIRMYLVVWVSIGRVVSNSNRWWKGFIFGVVQLFVTDIIQGEFTCGHRRVHRSPFPGAEAQNGTHAAPRPSHHLPNTFQNHRYVFNNSCTLFHCHCWFSYVTEFFYRRYVYILYVI